MSERILCLGRPPEPALVNSLEPLIRAVVRRLDYDEDCEALIAEINALSGQAYDSGIFFELYSWISEQEFAEAAAKGPPPLLLDLSKAELVAVVEAIGRGEEPNAAFFSALLDRNFPDTWSSDLLFYPHRKMTDVEIVDELILRNALFAAGGKEAVDDRRLALAREVMANPEAPTWAQQGARAVLDECGHKQGQ
jgi:hypothetical protein